MFANVALRSTSYSISLGSSPSSGNVKSCRCTMKAASVSVRANETKEEDKKQKKKNKRKKQQPKDDGGLAMAKTETLEKAQGCL